MNQMKQKLPGIALIGACMMLPTTASAYNFSQVFGGDVDVSIGGYAKLSAMWTDTDSGTIAGGAGGAG
ncbi:MAG: hypothetical protein AB2735_12275, partial [Candidatus Thiodiazotropha taylori]